MSEQNLFCDEIDDCPVCGGTGVLEDECTCGEDTCCCAEPEPPECPECRYQARMRNADG
jgi:hypothetical protein